MEQQAWVQHDDNTENHLRGTSDGSQLNLGSSDEENHVPENLCDDVKMSSPSSLTKKEKLKKLFQETVQAFMKNPGLDRLLPVGCVISHANVENVDLFDGDLKTGDSLAHKLCSESSPQEYHNFVELMVKLKKGAIFHVQNRWGNTAVHEALDQKLGLLPSTVKLLGEKCKFTFNTRDVYGNTELLLASISASVQVLEYMVQYGPKMEEPEMEKSNKIVKYGAGVKAINQDGRSVLHMASLGGNLEALEYLILKGANVHAKDLYGQTPLLCSVLSEGTAGRDYIGIIKILMKYGADVNAVSNVGANVLILAAFSHKTTEELKQIVNLGVELKGVFKGHMDILHQMAKKGNVETLKYFISLGVDVNSRNILQETPLHSVKYAKQNFIEIVNALVENGADINAVDGNGENVIVAASGEKGRTVEELKHLVTLGANWTKKNNDGNGIHHHLVNNQNWEAYRYFLTLLFLSDNKMN